LQPTPHPAYGSEFSTDGNRLVRALEGNGAGCRFTPRPASRRVYPSLVLQAAGPFPVSSTAPHYRRTKSESQVYFWTPAFSLHTQTAFYSRKKVVAIAAVMVPVLQATTLETCAQSGTDTSHCARVSPRVLFLRERLVLHASLLSLTDNPSGAYCCARKQCSSLKCSFRMTSLP